jgi:ATP-dependent protease ClpP protease subunit
MMTEITINGPIGAAGFGLADLQAAAPDGPVEIHLDSPGGDAVSALAIAKALHERPGSTVRAARAESAAVPVLAAARRRILASDGWLAVHPAWTATAGGASELEAAARTCRKHDERVAEMLARFSRLSRSDAAQAIRAGRVFDPEAALAAGLIDEIGPEAGVGKRPERIEDGPARAAATLAHEAHNNRLLAEYERRRAEREATGPTPEDRVMAYLVTAFTPPDRLASIFDAAAGHAIRESGKPWTARWTCEACGYINFSIPALRCQPTKCWHCDHPSATAGKSTNSTE